ncbi:MAG TPA: glycosyltransferase [bacterium]|nr:glycosyltransferase [bacterium]
MHENKSVAHITVPYLRPTETFIYDRIMNHKKYRPFILTDEPLQSMDIFPFGGRIYTLAGKNIFSRKLDAAFKRFAGRSVYFARVLGAKRPDVVHAHYGPVGAAVVPVAKSLGIPLVVSFYGVDASALLDHPDYIDSYRKMFKEASIISVLSDDMARTISEAGCPLEKIRVHHLAVDTGAIHQREFTEKDDKNRLRILSVGRMVPKKGMLYLIEAFSMLLNSGVDAELSIYGSGPLENEVKRRTADKGMQDHVNFRGHRSRNEVFAAMRRSDVFALFSVTAPDGDREGTPTVLIEAGAAGLPCVSTRHAGIPEIVIDDRTGFLVNEFDVAGFATRLIRFGNDIELKRAMGKAARKRIAGEFDINKVMSGIEFDYDSLA